MSGFLASIGSGAISATLGPLLGRLVDLIPDPVEKAKAAAEAQNKLLDADAAIIAAQNATNLEEAASESIFVSGWRPAVGWICGIALAWQVILQPFLSFGVNLFGYHPILPTVDSSFISLLLIPMLGLGAARTVEKIQGVSTPPPAVIKQLVRPHQSVLNLPSSPPGGN